MILPHQTQRKQGKVFLLFLTLFLFALLLTNSANASDYLVSGQNFLSIWDGDTHTIIDNITTNSNQNVYINNYLVYNNDSTAVYVAGTRIYKYNLSDLSYITISPVTTGNPTKIFYDKETDSIYFTTHYAGAKFKKLNATDLTEIKSATFSVSSGSIDELNGVLYVSDGGVGRPSLNKINKTDLSVIAESTLTGASNYVEVDNNFIYVERGQRIYKFYENLTYDYVSDSDISLIYYFKVTDTYIYAITTSNTIKTIDKNNLTTINETTAYASSLYGIRDYDDKFLYVIYGDDFALLNRNDLSVNKTLNDTTLVRDITILKSDVINYPPNPATDIKPSNTTITLNSTGVTIPINWSGGDDNNSDVVTAQIYLKLFSDYEFITNTTTKSESMTLNNSYLTSAYYQIYLNLTDGVNHTISTGDFFKLCVNDWSPSNTTCEDNLQTLIYTDDNECPLSYDVPSNNGSVSACDVGGGSEVIILNEFNSQTWEYTLYILFIILLLIAGYFIPILWAVNGLLMGFFSFMLLFDLGSVPLFAIMLLLTLMVGFTGLFRALSFED